MGIQFNASQGSGATSTVLDDYEEGNWTPVLEGGTTAGTASYSYRAGRYTKIGSKVFASCTIFATNFTGTGDFEVHGFPYPMSSAYPAVTASLQWNACPFQTFSVDNQAATAGLMTAGGAICTLGLLIEFKVATRSVESRNINSKLFKN